VLRFDENGDVITTVDLQDAEGARAWATESASRRPWRPKFRSAFAQVLEQLDPPPKRILELGSGPGLLAKRVLQDLSVHEYVLFDFSKPMMEMAREALGPRGDVSYALGDFKAPNWQSNLTAPFDAILSMQAVHEIRHKRHVPWLYSHAATLLRPGGLLIVCDAEPTPDQDEYQRHLASTRREQSHAMLWAGFEDVTCHVFEHQYYLISARRP
jgi:SAM-dependent methyltransferase